MKINTQAAWMHILMMRVYACVHAWVRNTLQLKSGRFLVGRVGKTRGNFFQIQPPATICVVHAHIVSSVHSSCKENQRK